MVKGNDAKKRARLETHQYLYKIAFFFAKKKKKKCIVFLFFLSNSYSMVIFSSIQDVEMKE